MPKRNRPQKESYHQSERQAWNWCKGNGRRCAIRRRRLNKKFDNYFIYGDMGGFILWLAAKANQGTDFSTTDTLPFIDSVHPEALSFLSRHGREFKPYVWKKPAPFGEPRRKQCFSNAWVLMIGQQKFLKKRPRYASLEKDRMHYAEGIAAGPMVSPMLHGWNVYGMGLKQKALDWTFYSAVRWIRYWGIAFTQEEHKELCFAQGKRFHAPCSFFHKEAFTVSVKIKMQLILARRKRAGKRMPIR